MVFLQRQQSCPMPSSSSSSSAASSTTPRRSSSYQLPMGDDDEYDNKNNHHHHDRTKNHQRPSYSSYYSSIRSNHCSTATKQQLNQKQYAYHSSSSPSSFHRFLLPLFYVTAMLSYGSSVRTKNILASSHELYSTERGLWQDRHSETLQLQTMLEQKQQQLQSKFQQMKDAQHRLKHEHRMKEEMMERVTGDNLALVMEHMKKQQTQTTLTWIQQRHGALLYKISLLQEHIQKWSRQQVVDKYGPGPHRVEFQVQTAAAVAATAEAAISTTAAAKNKKKKVPKTSNNQKATKISKFVVELAPIDEMPHAVESFLDMVNSKLWDQTIFYHHPTQSHIIAATPVKYGTFEAKHHHFQALGYDGIAFPEYSTSLPHEEYTIGFSGTGPNFYINTQDNSEHHGPGGQDHHDLAHDADPCFGTIVHGKPVIQEMMMMRQQQRQQAKKENAASSRSGSSSVGAVDHEPPIVWQDYDLTQIVQVRLL